MIKRIRNGAAGTIVSIAILLAGSTVAATAARAQLSPDADSPSERRAPRPDVGRTMEHEDPAIRRALALLDQGLNPVRIVSEAEIRDIYARIPDAGPPRPGLHAFRTPADPHIYVNLDSAIYRSAAAAPSVLTTLKLAATLLHEQIHDSDGELAACQLQADFIRSRAAAVPRSDRERLRAYLDSLDARGRALAHARDRMRSAETTGRARTPPRRGPVDVRAP